MKQYLNFSNKGGQLFGAWISFILLFLVPYIWVVYQMSISDFEAGENYYLIPVVIGLVLIAIFIEFYIYRFFITGIQYKEINIEFKGRFSEFVGIILINTLLTIITAGVYYPWFIKKLYDFFVNNSKYNDSEFKFLSKGGPLLLIFVFAALLPAILISLFTASIISIIDMNSQTSQLLVNFITYLIMSPYIYLLYKWAVNIRYKEYTITWKTEFFSSVVMIIGQMTLSMISLGIYTPLAMLRIYKYFANKTQINSDDKSMKFEFKNKMTTDFFFIWVQILFTLITAFIYLPWAWAKISQRILSQTSISE